MARTPSRLAVRSRRFQPLVEALECRLTPALPATMNVGDTNSFTDTNGNNVTVMVQGTTGSASFNGGAGVANGANIATIGITNASSDFHITFVDNTTVLPGTTPIALGAITVANNKPIRGIFTVDADAVDSDFTLTSFTGKGLSGNGSINVDNVTGNIDITRLGVRQAINVHDDLVGDLLIAVDLAGSVNVAGDFSGDLEVDGNWVAGGLVGVTNPLGTWGGAVTVAGSMGGEAIAGGPVSGIWQINGSVQSSARMTVGDNFTSLNVAGNFNGRLTALGTIDLDVDNSIGGKAKITSGTGALIFAQQSVKAGSIISVLDDGGDVDLDITFGDFGGTVQAEDTVDVTLATGSVLDTASFNFANGLINVATGKFGGTATGLNLDFRVGGNVTKTALIQVAFIADSLVDIDSDGMRVLGNFAGVLEVGFGFSSGAGSSTNVINGKITSTARITVASPTGGAASYRFGNRLEGQLTFLGDLTQNLSVGGSVTGSNAGIWINGNVLADISITGGLSFLSSHSLYDPVNANSGDFRDGANNITGTLVVGGSIGTIVPSL